MEKLKQLPLGYRFIPTDSELIVDYLIKKLKNQQLSCNAVVEYDIYTTEPWNLKGNNNNDIGGAIDKGYYFVNREKKTAGSKKRPNRTVKPRDGSRGGFWKAAGADKKILDKRNNVVGLKKQLKYYCYTSDKRVTNEKEATRWIMHEYTLPSSNDEFQPWVLCSIRFTGDDEEYQRQYHKLEQEAVPDHLEHQEVLEQYDQRGKQQQFVPGFKVDMNMVDYAKGGGGLPQGCEASSSIAMAGASSSSSSTNYYHQDIPVSAQDQLTNIDYQEWDEMVDILSGYSFNDCHPGTSDRQWAVTSAGGFAALNNLL